MIEGDPDERWRDCRVIDAHQPGPVSELLDTSPEETESRHIILAVHLRAEVKNAGPARRANPPGGHPVRRPHSRLECAYLASLAEVDAHW